MVATRLRWAHALALLVIVSCGHTIRPSIAIRYDELTAMNRRPETIRLVITDEYQNFVSHDRGHALADLQRYEIGPALAEITKRYFRAGFCEVVVGSATISNGHVDFVVTPIVDRFDNQISLSSLRQQFEIRLAALIASTESTDVRRVAADQTIKGFGFEQRRNERTGRGELIPGATSIAPTPKDRAEKLLGLQMQEAVKKLVQQIGSELDAMQPPGAPRSCKGAFYVGSAVNPRGRRS